MTDTEKKPDAEETPQKDADSETEFDDANIPDGPLSEPRVFNLDARKFIMRIFWLMVGLELFGMAFDYLVYMRKIIPSDNFRDLANITREDCVASWIGITQTFMIGMTLWLILALVKKSKDVKRYQIVGWAILAVFFTYMAFDDGSRFHERMGSVFSEVFKQDGGATEASSLGTKLAHTFPSYYWQIIFVPPMAAVGLFMVWFLWKEIRDRRMLLLVLTALGLLATAVAIDFVEGLGRSHPLNIWGHLRSRELDMACFRTYGRSSYEVMVHFSKSFEETLEMFANTLFWVVFLNYLADRAGKHFHVRFYRSPKKAG